MRAALIALGLFAVGCSTMTSQLRSRFAKERECPEGQVQVVERGGNVYIAHGCGQRAEYVCSGFASASSNTCEERGLQRQASPTGDPEQFPESPTQPLAPGGPR